MRRWYEGRLSSVRRPISKAVWATPVSRGWSGVHGSLSKSRPRRYGMNSCGNHSCATLSVPVEQPAGLGLELDEQRPVGLERSSASSASRPDRGGVRCRSLVLQSCPAKRIPAASPRPNSGALLHATDRTVDSGAMLDARHEPLRRVTATRYVTPLREGGSLPGLVEADDDGLYVVKFRGAGQGPRALVAEWLAGEHRPALGLPVPDLVADRGRPGARRCRARRGAPGPRPPQRRAEPGPRLPARRPDRSTRRPHRSSTRRWPPTSSGWTGS